MLSLNKKTTVPNSVIFSLFLEYISSITSQDQVYQVFLIDRLKTLWETADTEHRHVFIDIIANGTILKGSRRIPWHEYSLEGPHQGLVYAMTAISKGFNELPWATTPDLGDTRTTTALAEEIRGQVAWRTIGPYLSSPYLGSTGFHPRGEGLYTQGPNIHWHGIESLIIDLAAVALTPPQLAPLVFEESRVSELYDLERYAHPDTREALEYLETQKVITDTAVTPVFIALGACPESIPLKILNKQIETITSEEYRVWADAMEGMFPARKYARDRIAQGVMYTPIRDWVYRLATQEISSTLEYATETVLKPLGEGQQRHIMEWEEQAHREKTLKYTEDTFTL